MRLFGKEVEQPYIIVNRSDWRDGRAVTMEVLSGEKGLKARELVASGHSQTQVWNKLHTRPTVPKSLHLSMKLEELTHRQLGILFQRAVGVEAPSVDRMNSDDLIAVLRALGVSEVKIA